MPVGGALKLDLGLKNVQKLASKPFYVVLDHESLSLEGLAS